MSVNPQPLNLFTRHNVNNQPTLLIYLGLIALIGYAFTRTGFPDAAKIFSAIATLLGFWGLYKYGKQVNSHKLFRFIWVAILLQLITWVLSQINNPEWALAYPKLDYIARWFVFIPFAWWAAQYKSSIALLWGSAALGILVSPWTTGYGIQEIIDGANGKRIDFGLRNAQHTAMYFGTVFLGLCCFTVPLYKKHKFLLIPTIALIIFCSFSIIASETRQAWLGLTVTFLCISSYFIYQKTKSLSTNKRLIFFITFITGLIIIAAIALSNDRISERISREQETIKMLQTFNFEQLPYSSIGIRIHSWAAALDFIKEKPIFGWGSNGQALVMQKTVWPENTMPSYFDHLHSHYIETLANFGIIGLLFYFSIWFVIGRMLFKEIKANNIEKEFGYFFSSVSIFWGIIYVFESYLSMWTGVFYFNVFMTGIIGKIWHVKINDKYSERS